jgi:hypothetical protein
MSFVYLSGYDTAFRVFGAEVKKTDDGKKNVWI